jgi:hypothetical protein
MASDAGKPVPRIGVAETFMARNAGNAGTSHRRDRYRRNGDGYHETSRQEHVVGPLSIAASPAVGGQGGTAWAAGSPEALEAPAADPRILRIGDFRAGIGALAGLTDHRRPSPPAPEYPSGRPAAVRLPPLR